MTRLKQTHCVPCAVCDSGILLHDLGSWFLLCYWHTDPWDAHRHDHTRKTQYFLAGLAGAEVCLLGLAFRSVFSDILQQKEQMQTCLRKTGGTENSSPRFSKIIINWQQCFSNERCQMISISTNAIHLYNWLWIWFKIYVELFKCLVALFLSNTLIHL